MSKKYGVGRATARAFQSGLQAANLGARAASNAVRTAFSAGKSVANYYSPKRRR